MSQKLQKIKSWLESFDYRLEMGKSDFVVYDLGLVILNPRQSKKHLVYSALHECGHIILANQKSYNKDFKVLNKAHIDGRVMKSDVYKYKQLREEIEAWEFGYKLAQSLGIKINKDDYDKYAAKCFKTYIKFYA